MTRRQSVGRIALATGCMAFYAAKLTFAKAGEVSRNAESIHQEPTFTAGRTQIYEMLIDTGTFDKVIFASGSASNPSLGTHVTSISRDVGGVFSIFGGHIIGRQLEIVPNQRIVQAWRVVDWDAGVYSIARFELVEQSQRTKIIFDHTGFPNGKGEHLAFGWKTHYWEPMEKLLAQSPR